MKYVINDGWLANVSKKESPNFDERAVKSDISLVVIHNISLPPQQYGNTYIERFFCNELDYSIDPYFETIKSFKVSAHLLIKRTGEVVQFVGFNNRAWHAGISSYKGRENCNDFSIGIELEGSDFDGFELQQYEVLKDVLRCLCDNYPKLSFNSITGHSDIAPGRKTDPGPFFDWDKIT